MTNIFLSKKTAVFAAVFFGGLLITAGILASFGFSAFKPIAAAKSLQWTQETGEGISVPACASSSPPPSVTATCIGGAPFVTFSWTVEGPDPDSVVCSTASITAGPSGGPQPIIATGQSCTGGSFDWSGATLFNTTYTYSINFENGGHIISSGSFQTPGYCTAPSPTPPPPTVSCSVAPPSATTGQNVTWTAVPSGGEAGLASGVISQSFESGWSPTWITSGQDQTMSARRFQASSSYWLKKVSLSLSRETTTTGRIRITIENDAGGLPSGSAIIGGTSDLVNVSSVCIWTCLNWIDFTLPGVELTAGTNYWIVLRGYFDGGDAFSVIHHAGPPLDSNPGSQSLIRGWTNPSVWYDKHIASSDLWYRTYAATSLPSYSYSWLGSTPTLDSQIGSPVDISYPSTGDKFGNVTVTSGQTSDPAACSNSVDIVPNPIPTVDLSASPLSIPWDTASTLSWASTDATSCTASGAWSGPKSTSGSEPTGNITVFPSTYTMTCSGPGGTSAPDSVTINQSTPTLAINLTSIPSPATGNIPLAVDLTAAITAYNGNPAESVNYTFWWDCSDPSNDVSYLRQASVCGEPTNPAIGAKLDGRDAGQSLPSESVAHTYSVGGSYTAKVVVERSAAIAQTDTVPITATIPPLAGLSCDVNPRTARTGDNVTWSATWSGGQPVYTVIWSGDAPLPRTISSSVTSSSVVVQYAEPGNYDGSARVEFIDENGDTQTLGPVICTNIVKVAPKFEIR